MGNGKFDVKNFWKDMKKMFPEIDLNSINEDAKWTTQTKAVMTKNPF